MASISIREEQKHALKIMLNLNTKSGNSSSLEPVWKILVYDKIGQDIISPILTVKELRELGITLYLYLHSDRDPIPDVPVVYFVSPSEENIMRICQDLRNHVYDNYYLNFISPISRQKLEDLANSALQGNVQNCVKKVFDQYLNFVSMEDDMFVLKNQTDEVSYYAINRGDVKESEMERVMDILVDGLFSVFVTLGVIPIIRCPKGSSAEMVAEKLSKKIKENIQDTRHNLFKMSDFSIDDKQNKPLNFQRPLLVILDRNMDMATPLHHTWTYQALVHDVLDLKLNQVKVSELGGDSVENRTRNETKTYDLSSFDNFWVKYKGNPFPEVAEAIQEALEAYRISEREVKGLKSEMSFSSDRPTTEPLNLMSDTTAKLTNAMSTLPELLEKKRLIDMHTTIATNILNQIKIRKLDSFFEIEEKIMTRATDKMDMFQEPDSGSSKDKTRSFLINFLYSSMNENETKQFEKSYIEHGCDLPSLNYMKRLKTFMPQTNSHYTGGTKTVNMFSKLVSQGSQFVMEGVKNLVLKKHILPVTRIVDALMDMKAISDVEDYNYYDPKIFKSSNINSKSRKPFQDAIVFMVGGGNYIEYQNLLDYSKSKAGKSSSKRILYGCTELMNADRFLEQISKLGEEL